MKKLVITGLAALAFGGGAALAQPGGGAAQPVGNEVSGFQYAPNNIAYPGVLSGAESCAFDPARNQIYAVNTGSVSIVNPDGSVHTPRWLDQTRDEGVALNNTLGSAIKDGVLYVNSAYTVRAFDLQTGQPLWDVTVPDLPEGLPGNQTLNGIAVGEDGSVYATITHSAVLGNQTIYKIAPDRTASVFVRGAPLNAPNGIAIDPDGNIVTVGISTPAVLTFNTEGELVNTEQSTHQGNDGLAILSNGVKYVSSVTTGNISIIRPGEEAQVIASGVGSASSICYDSVQHQLIVPRNAANALVFIALDPADRPAAPARAPADLTTELVAEFQGVPVLVTQPAGDDRLFIVDKAGAIRIVDAEGALVNAPFLNVGSVLSNNSSAANSEQGLLGLAFHPDYAENGQFFISFTNGSGVNSFLNVVRFNVSAQPNVADAGSWETIIRVPQLANNHNGGWIGFGPDGYLYITTGDGGGGNARMVNGQDPDILLGKILRIDVDTPSEGQLYSIPAGNPFDSEVFALGLRNPWRASFDGDLLYIGDVGELAWEEVSVLDTVDGAGTNFGWSTMEATHCYLPAEGCETEGLTLPILEVQRTGRATPPGYCSITGGYVYRGDAIPEIDGHYFWGDWCNGRIHSLVYEDGAVALEVDWTEHFGFLGAITGWGQDDDGEIYVLVTNGPNNAATASVFKVVRE